MELDKAAYIKQKRINMGLTQLEMASLLGLKENGDRTVRGWELGEHLPTPTKWKLIEKLPDISPFKYDDSKTPSFKFIDLFAGIGGIRIPFQEAGGKCVFTSEWDKFSQKTYAANFGELPSGDITKISASDIPAHDVLLAGFPCQAFSQAGLRKGFYDTRGTMFFEIQRIIAEKRPKAFLLENVKQLRGHDKGRTLQTILEILQGECVQEIPDDVPMTDESRGALAKKLNYKVFYKVLRAADFDVPQNRERIFIVGFDLDQFDSKTDFTELFEWPEPAEKTKWVGDILDDHEKLDAKYTISQKLLDGHERRKIEHQKKGNGFGFSVFEESSPYTNTISARYYKDGSEILIKQPDEVSKRPRKLTPKECARLQGFPDKFLVDAVSDTQIYRQFGNSVAVPVVRAVSKKMLAAIEKAEALSL